MRARPIAVLLLLLALAFTAPTAAAQDSPIAEPIVCSPLTSIDTPSPGAVVSSSVLVRGWALDVAQPDGKQAENY